MTRSLRLPPWQRSSELRLFSLTSQRMIPEMFRKSATTIWMSLWAFVCSGIGGGQEFVLCIGQDGHFALEGKHEECPSQAIPQRTAGLSRPAASTPTGCSDFAILASAHVSAIRSEQRVVETTKALPASTPLAVRSNWATTGHRQPIPRASGADPTVLSLRTVVLLI